MWARRTGLVAFVSMLVVACAGCTAIAPTPRSPVPTSSASARTTTAAYRPTPTPKVDLLTPTDLACGSTIAPDVYSSHANTVPLQHTEAGVDFNVTNVAAATNGRGTVVSARLGAEAPDPGGVAAAHYSGDLRIALVRDSTVVASARAGTPSGSVAALSTALLSSDFAADSCSSGRRLPDGIYGLLVVGPAVQFLGETVHVAAAIRRVQLTRGLLIGDITSAPDGPWHGTGVPTCGTKSSTAEATAFAARNATARVDARITAKITGFEPHANAEGWFFVVTVTNTGRSTVRFAEGASSTAVLSGGRIVSAPDSMDFTTTAPTHITLAAGKSLRVFADAADAGCTLSVDYTTFGPRLPDVVHFGFIDLGLTTPDGLGVVLAQRYDFDGTSNGRKDRPELVG